jgi:hypothetical protein
MQRAALGGVAAARPAQLRDCLGSAIARCTLSVAHLRLRCNACCPLHVARCTSHAYLDGTQLHHRRLIVRVSRRMQLLLGSAD